MIAEGGGGVLDAAYFAHAKLDEPIDTAKLATVARLSPHHFHRRFRDAFGEAPAAYVRRLRLERAAWRLQLHTDNVLSIALDCGFADHETFSRAFKRRFGVSPTAYRRAGRFPAQSRRERDHAQQAGDYHLSPTRIRTLKARAIAFIRHTGRYEAVDPGLWEELSRWADARGLPPERALFGIGHDSPSITAPARLRFDAAISVPPGTRGDARVRIGTLDGCRCAVTTHIGAYATLPAAYPHIFEQSLRAAPGLAGLPAIEQYDDQAIDLARVASRTEVHLPIVR